VNRFIPVIFLLGLAGLGFLSFSLYQDNAKLGKAANVVSEQDKEIATLKQTRNNLEKQVDELKLIANNAGDQAFIDLQPMIITLSDERDTLAREVVMLKQQITQQASGEGNGAINPAAVTALVQERDNLLKQVSSLQNQLSAASSGLDSEVKKQMTAILGERDNLAKSLALLTGERDSLKAQIGQLQTQIQNFISQAQSGAGETGLNQLLQGLQAN
jgi:chromosome segregation ATPase